MIVDDPVLLEMLTAQVQRGVFRLSSGRLSTYYLDARKATMTARGAREVGLALMRLVVAEHRLVHAIGGPVVAAVPLVGACLASAWQRPDLVGFYVRTAVKDHGAGGRIQGPLEPGMTAVLIDDVATSGGSLLDSARAVREFGCTVNTAFCLVDRLEGAAEALNAEGIALLSLFTICDLGVKPEEEIHEEAGQDPLP